MAELAQMFIDVCSFAASQYRATITLIRFKCSLLLQLGRLVEDQDEAFDVINDNASDVEKNVEKGSAFVFHLVLIELCHIISVLILHVLAETNN